MSRMKRIANQDKPSCERVAELLLYDPLTGLFRWKMASGRGRARTHLAGYYRPKRGLLIVVDGVHYPGSHLAWLLTYGEWPPVDRFVDHKDCDPRNNRIDNLRLATYSQNGQNRRMQNKGVRRTKYNTWEVTIDADNKRIYLGTFPTEKEARATRDAATIKYHGEFARL